MVSIATSTDYSKRVPKIATKLGRFAWFRDMQSMVSKFHYNIHELRMPASRSLTAQDSYIFNNLINVDQCVKEVNEMAMFQGFYLPETLTKQILEFAIAHECIEPQSFKHFYISDVDNTITQDYIYRGLVTNTLRCDAINRIKCDGTLLKIVTKFLGYAPTKITQHLTWSLPVPVEESQILKHYPASRWHYDVVGSNSLTVNFYITDVNDDNFGAHQFLAKSHKKQPWQLLIKPNTIDESSVNKYFPNFSKSSIIGQAGYGFIENPLCIHRVKPPVNNNRLILQIRYS